MNAFSYQQQGLAAESVPLAAIADAVGTPVYVYSSRAIVERYRRFVAVFAGRDILVAYAMKANSNQAVLRTLVTEGAGMDVVSEGELRRALAAGCDPKRIVFAGVGKSETEMAVALDAGILQFNVESLPELEALNRVAAAKGMTAPVGLRINPDVDALTHEKISTGKADNKFGIAYDDAPAVAARARALPGIALESLAVHIGSQLLELSPYRAAFERLVALYRRLLGEGYQLQRLDFGGGLGIPYRDETPPSLEAYAETAKELTRDLPVRLIFEPGRHLVGEAGVLLVRTLYVKQGEGRSFLIVDGAMNDLIRPTLYEAWHDIVPVKAPAPDAVTQRYDIVGPVCESGDFFAKERPLAPPQPGDLLAICNTGAYGAVMASTYNSRLLAPEVLVKGDDFFVVRPRPDYATLLGQDRVPPWLTAHDDNLPVQRKQSVAG